MSAGESLRFRQDMAIKKHWIRIEGKPIWLFVADTLQQRYNFTKVIITASKRDVAYMKRFCSYEIVEGGKMRQESLMNALRAVSTEFVAVSDAARYNLDMNVLDRLFGYDLTNIDCLCPVIGVNDTIFAESSTSKTYLDRSTIRLVQTPQISRVSTLKKALELGNFTDESSAINHYGGNVSTIEGSMKMNKLTYATDLKYIDMGYINKRYIDRKAESYPKTFVGYGFDVHRFCENKPMILGGVEIECDVGLEAHSDGDVVIHALCDALLGAIGAGDIGEWFPPSDDTYKNISSKVLLQEIAEFIASVGFVVVNIDIMILAQKPKIITYKDKMIENFSKILNLQRNCINIKATTMEGLGFVGREEGICASANVSLVLQSLEKLTLNGDL